MIQYLIVCPLVFLAGLVDSIAGGGGLISLPAYLICGVPAHMALGTNKLSSASGTLISTLRLAKHGYLKGRGRMAACASVAAILGAIVGAHLALLVSDTVIRHMMIVVLPIVAYYVLRSKNMGREGAARRANRRREFLVSVGAGFVVGIYDGFYGPGTGTFLILILTGLARMDMRTAAAETKVINLSSNLSALATFVMTGNVYYPLGIAAAACSIAGHYLGAGLVVHDGQKVIRPVVLLVLAILFVKILTGG